jgi:hypothetical protein
MRKYFIFIPISFFIYFLMAELGAKKSDLIFSHKFHVEEVGSGCTDCHDPAEESEKATDNLLPAEETCLACHDQSETSCDFCHSSKDPGKSFYRIQSTSFKFSHKNHIQKGKDCLTCHKGIENKTRVSEKLLTVPRSICLECHENVDYSENPDNCYLCHEKTISLKPADHHVNWNKEHGIVSEGDRNNCNHCHQKNYCLSCHEGDNLDHLIHPLNFRNNHGIFATGNKDNCMTCHQTNAFCQDCHLIQMVRPKNHYLSSWITSGGGKHAIDAMADFDKCVSCHDDMNSDLVCIVCHQK